MKKLFFYSIILVAISSFVSSCGLGPGVEFNDLPASTTTIDLSGKKVLWKTVGWRVATTADNQLVVIPPFPYGIRPDTIFHDMSGNELELVAEPDGFMSTWEQHSPAGWKVIEPVVANPDSTKCFILPLDSKVDSVIIGIGVVLHAQTNINPISTHFGALTITFKNGKVQNYSAMPFWQHPKYKKGYQQWMRQRFPLQDKVQDLFPDPTFNGG